MNRIRSTLTLATVALLLAGCSAFEVSADQMPEAHGANGHAETTAPLDGAPEIEILADALRFEPARLELDAGEPVNLVIRSEDTLHDLTIDEAGFHVAADTDGTAAGGLADLDPGTYVAYCSVPGHREAGMELDIVIS